MNLLTSNNLLKIGLYYSAIVPLFIVPNMIALYFIIPVVFIFCFSKCRLYYENCYIVIYSLLVIWILFSTVTTNYLDLTIVELKALLGTVMMCYVVSVLALDEDKRPFLYSLWIAYYIGMLLYIPQMEVFKTFDMSKDRLNDKFLNANTIAYQTFYLTFSLFMIGNLTKEKKKLFEYLFLSTILLSPIVALFTGSRQVLLVQVPLICSLIYLRYSKLVKHAKTYIILIVIFAIVLLLFFDKIEGIFANSVLASRYGTEVKEDARAKLIEAAIAVGCEYPILGVGPGNFLKFNSIGGFSHCTYTELFANCGFIASFLYIYMLYVYLKKQIKYYFVTKDKIFLAFLIFGIIYAFDNLFFVFYYALWLLPFFFLVAGHSEYHYRSLGYK